MCVEQFEQLGRGVLVQGVLELSKCGWDFKSLVQNLFLSLKLNVLRPFDKSREVAFWLDSLSDAKVPRSLLDERILRGLLRGCGLLRRERGFGSLGSLYRD